MVPNTETCIHMTTQWCCNKTMNQDKTKQQKRSHLESNYLIGYCLVIANESINIRIQFPTDMFSNCPSAALVQPDSSHHIPLSLSSHKLTN